MSYYQLPKINYTIKPKNIRLTFGNNDEKKIINKSLGEYLNAVKQEINKFIPQWDDAKKITNPYEYIHSNIPYYNMSISKVKPISRSFFKIIEICNIFHLFDNFKSSPLKSYHLAEGPGGFIEAFTFMRKNKKDIYYGMTLIDNSNNKIPGWKKTDIFLSKNKNVIIDYGKTKTGNLYHPDNLKYCFEKYRNSIDIITADGGFDFSLDFNKQESMIFRLLLSEIAFALAIQKQGGHFILKVFDIFHQSSVELIYLLSCFYERVYIIKPHTSRHANSEKYIVCKKFKFSDTTEITDKFISVFHVLDKLDFKKYSISSIIDIPIQYYYILMLTETNAIFGQQQIENIIKTMTLIEHNNIRRDYMTQNKSSNIQKCIQWCLKNKIPYNKNMSPKNIFLGTTT